MFYSFFNQYDKYYFSTAKRDVQELYILISVLDGKIVEMACNSLNNDDYALMKFLIESMDAATDNRLYTKYNELQSQFHDVYMIKCGNKIIADELSNKKNIFIEKNYMHTSPETISKHLTSANKEQKKLLDLLKQHKNRDARAYLEMFIGTLNKLSMIFGKTCNNLIIFY